MRVELENMGLYQKSAGRGLGTFTFVSFGGERLKQQQPLSKGMIREAVQ